MTVLSRRAVLTAGLGVIASCSTTTTIAGSDTASTSVGTSGGSTPQQPRTIESVAIIGDSITHGSADELREAFAQADVDDVVIDGEASRRIASGNGRNGNTLSGARAVQRMLDDGHDPTVWVIALGTNDIGGYSSDDECAELIGQILELLPPPVLLVWVNTYRPSLARSTEQFNDVLADLLAGRGDALVADWHSLVADPDNRLLRSDKVHPNDAGQLAFAELIVQTVQRL